MAEIELRPLTLGELLDQTFSLYRKHFLLFVGIMAIPTLFSVAANILTSAIQGGAVADSNPGVGQIGLAVALVVSIFLAVVIFWLVYGLALGATTVAVSEVYLGRTATIRQAYASIQGKYWRIIDLLFSMGLRIMGVVFLTGMVGGLLMVVATTAFSPLGQVASGILGGIVVLVIFALIFIAAGWLMLRWSVSLPALLIENTRARAAMKRSVELTKGRRRFVFVIGLLTTIISYVAILIFQGPFLILNFVYLAQQQTVPHWVNTLSAFTGGLSMALAGPILSIALVLFYYDLRVRKEAFDIQLMMQALDRVSSSPAPEPPPAGTAP